MLGATGILNQKEADEIARGLDKIAAEIEAGTFTFSRALEDIHLNVESRLRRADRTGRRQAAYRALAQRPGGDRLQALCPGRDRRDRRRARARSSWRSPTKALDHAGAVMPGFTHLQTAQPDHLRPSSVSLMSRCWRATGAASPMRAKRLTECPLGAAALAGTSFPIDRDATAKALGFARPAANSLDAVSDRDFALETLAAACDRRHASVAARRGDRAVDLAAIRLRAAVRQVHHRLIDHAAEAEPRRGRAGARQDRAASPAPSRRCSW